jgi:ubiquinone/menaquinone biosynthesis C-methylase UbiE
MRVEQERASGAGSLPPWTRHEHRARYEFAATYAEGREVVDCASGDGTCGRLLVEAGAALVRGFDLSAAAVADANAAHASARLVFEVADAASLPVDDDSADLFVSLETIEHLPDEHRFLAEVARVLRPGGTFVCSTPDRDVYSPGHRPGSRPWNRYHVREHSQEEFGDLLRSYFADVALFGQNRRSPRVTAYRNRLGRRLPGDLVVRIGQAGKLPRFLYDRLDMHLVEPLEEGFRYEFLVAVCTGPVTPAQASVALD